LLSREAMPSLYGVGVVAVLAGCAYKPGSFRAPLHPGIEGERATAGCLDVVVSPETRAEAEGEVVQVFFANRCDRPTVVDFPALRATGRDAAGNERSLAIYDPQHELRPLVLEARITGREIIELHPTTYSSPPERGLALDSVCLDAGSLARSDARWVCLTSRAVAAVAVAP
jgi:hypothetical protein